MDDLVIAVVKDLLSKTGVKAQVRRVPLARTSPRDGPRHCRCMPPYPYVAKDLRIE